MNEQFVSLTVNDIPTHICSTDKYKTNSIALYIRQPLEEEHHTKVPLISEILNRGTEKYPTAGKLRQALGDLYGASLFTDVMKRGEEQVVVFRLQIANEKFLTDRTPLFEKGIQLLSEVLLRPLLEEGVFTQKFVDLEKDLLKRRLSQIKDDKTRYANKRCVEEMFKEERFRLFANGSLEQIEQLTASELYEYYQKMIQSHPIELFVIGDIEKEEVEKIIQRHLDVPRQKMIEIPKTIIERKVTEEREVIEKVKISQGKLHIGCRTHTAYSDPEYVALLVCNGVFGGFPHSKLFSHVREKESLAYYVTSSVESHKGFMMIMSGIEFKNYKKTVDIIREQLAETAQGNISEKELEQTKAMLINQIRESSDQPFQQMERHFHGVIGGVKRSSDELIELIENVSKEEIQEVARKIEMDTIFFLTSENEGVQS
jgi:predicted Zn-dependent peptidase